MHSSDCQRRIDRCLELTIAELAHRSDTGLATLVRDVVLAPGHRIRPVWMITVHCAFGGSVSEWIVRLACAFEMLHVATLLLDDLPCMDDGKIRRGLPALHTVKGDAAAVLASATLQMWSLYVIEEAWSVNGPHRDSDVVVRWVSEAVNLTLTGQCRDLANAGRTPEDVLAVHSLKTGAAFELVGKVGAHAAGASPRSCDLIGEIGRKFGTAYQIRDDLADVMATRLVSEKDTGKDDGRPNLARLVGRAVTAEYLRTIELELLRLIAQTCPKSDALSACLFDQRWSPFRLTSTEAGSYEASADYHGRLDR